MQSLMVAHEKFKVTLGDADKEFQAIVGLETQVHEMLQKFGMTGRIENPYTTLNANVSWRFCHFYPDQYTYKYIYVRLSGW